MIENVTTMMHARLKISLLYDVCNVTVYGNVEKVLYIYIYIHITMKLKVMGTTNAKVDILISNNQILYPKHHVRI